MVFSAAYYGLLNVLDPSVAYDSDGKIISAYRPEKSGDENENQIAGREPGESKASEEDPRSPAEETADDAQSVAPSVRSNAASVHSNAASIHSNARSVHSKTGSVHSKAGSVYSKAASVHSKAASVHSRAASVHSKVPSVHSRAASVHSKAATVQSAMQSSQSRTPSAHQKTPYSGDSDTRSIPKVETASEDCFDIKVNKLVSVMTGESFPFLMPVLSKQGLQESQNDPITREEAEKAVSEGLKHELKKTEKAEFGWREEKQEESKEMTLEDSLAESQPVTEETLVHDIENVVDYSNATPLFKAIQRRNWHAVLYFLRTGSFSFSPLLARADTETINIQSRTWVRQKDINDKEMWRELPLHAAICYGARKNVIDKLIEVYPDALRCPDSHGNLPLHLAFIFDADDEVTACLLKRFPASVHVMNDGKLQPIQCSAEICSRAFQSKGELFDALSDYSRAVAENDPDKLVEQLEDVRRQLKAVNDTLFPTAPPRKPEAILLYMAADSQLVQEQPLSKEVGYGPSAFIAELSSGICPGVQRYSRDAVIIPSGSEHALPSSIVESLAQQKIDPEQQTCRVMEFDPSTKTWREV